MNNTTLNNLISGIFATEHFKRSDFVVEYAGELINATEANYREYFYASRDPTGSSYMFYFRHNGKTWW